MRDTSDPFSRFSGIVETPSELTDIVGTPPAFVVDKELDRLDDLCREFIAASPFCLIATAGRDGHIDISPKGDPAGFVQVLSDTMLAIPDRPGNRRTDTFHNLLENDRIGLIFLIPGKGETLRVRGRGRIVRDDALRETMAINGKAPKLALVVHVTEAFLHCPKCIARSHLWQPDAWGETAHLADIRLATSRHANRPEPIEELDAWAKREGLIELY